mmetsp:Transcript_9922/g.9810  ORF Transcript_9922/g.9810 Transcript_9922/m.9810 type:complete len:110 (+) Transcript_9922:218-547(+)
MLYAAYHYGNHQDEFFGSDNVDPLVAVAGSINYAGRLDHTFSIVNSLLTATRGRSKESAGEYAVHFPNKFRPILFEDEDFDEHCSLSRVIVNSTGSEFTILIISVVSLI